jgi:hypothetical protein
VEKRGRQITAKQFPVALTADRNKQHKESRVAGEMPTPPPLKQAAKQLGISIK